MPGHKPNSKTPPVQHALTYTFAGATAMSGLSEATLRRRAREGQLRLVRVGSRTLVVGDSLRRLLGTERCRNARMRACVAGEASQSDKGASTIIETPVSIPHHVKKERKTSRAVVVA